MGKLKRPFDSAARVLHRQASYESLWALKDVSFEVSAGEVVGFIGLNGAGKSTLLKILSRITEPTEGRALVSGRVGTLLEVGTGFHPELTGRENIYLSGAILGMRKEEIRRKFDEIAAFSEIERFLDTPVKRYSSGMYVRLAFAVAAHLEPEVLLVDEVLAVGDVTFQKKCLGKMQEVGSQGRTVLFVSHNMVAVQSLCNRVIWLASGKVREDGPATEVVRSYLTASSGSQNEMRWDGESAPGNHKVRLRRVSIRPEEGKPGDLLGMSTPLLVELEYWSLAPGVRLHVSLHLGNEHGLAFTSDSNETDASTRDVPLAPGLYRSACRIPGNLLNAGVHALAVLFREHGRKLVLRIDNAVRFEVLDLEQKDRVWLRGAQGVVHPKLAWSTTRIGVPLETMCVGSDGVVLAPPSCPR